MSKPFALIVEDDAQLSNIFSKTLEMNFETEVASDGNTAFTRLAQTEPKIVVLDLNLPGMAGKDILHSIRLDPRLENTRVILCTADERQAEMLSDKADLILLKPVSPSQLREMATRLAR